MFSSPIARRVRVIGWVRSACSSGYVPAGSRSVSWPVGLCPAVVIPVQVGENLGRQTRGRPFAQVVDLRQPAPGLLYQVIRLVTVVTP